MAALAMTGCTDQASTSNLSPDGPPAVVQIFFYDSDGALTLGYGVHAEFNKCDLDFMPCSGSLTCAQSGVLSGHCVDTAGNQVPGRMAPSGRIGVSGAFDPAGEGFEANSEPRLRLVIKELLRGNTVEQFWCGCSLTGFTAAGIPLSDITKCPVSGRYSLDPFDCSACADNPLTTDANEAGTCLDGDDSGNPDKTSFQPGIVTVRCGALDTWVTGVDDGWYDPGGSQLVPILSSFLGVGPALQLNPGAHVFPTNTSCTVAFKDSVTDKDGVPFTADPALAFTTEPLRVLASDPEKPAAGPATLVPVDQEFRFLFNSSITAPVAGDIELRDSNGAVVTLAAPASELQVTGVDGDNDTIVVSPAAALNNNANYTIRVKTTVKDKFGVATPTEFVLQFTTEP